MTKYQRYHRTRRQRLLARLGNACVNCDSRTDLQVAHLDGDGGVERKRRGSAGVITYLLSLPAESLHEYVCLFCPPCHLKHDLAAGHMAWQNER